ncbi:hypothetical protein NKR19_g3150 [Coniochaeta hoffmannii]|uniref:Cenp-O kinetochore centromere component n=1 Tax=Coniochaeta hoffmannii TaxID=91930 RepID=A0AA38SHC7_9PEZI|nr:hypothetical protein NKR19_g3150 [Coniochaeta hoffmannii]
MAAESFSSKPPAVDDEIASLKKRAKQLRADIKTHISTLASSYALEDFPSDLVDAINQQQAHTQESLWRIGAGVTAFRARDPDPRAVDGGSVLGIRFEIMRSGRFLQPYVVLLNKPYASEGDPGADDSVAKTYLRVHRHTIPNCIPLGGLAARYLPPPTVGDADADAAPAKRRVQNLIADMRRAAGLAADETKGKGRRGEDGRSAEHAPASSDEDENPEGGGDAGTPRITEISLADAEAKQIKIDWSNGDVCRLVIDDGGEIEKCVMYGAQGRDMPAAREFLQRVTRVEKLPGSIRRKRGLKPE